MDLEEMVSQHPILMTGVRSQWRKRVHRVSRLSFYPTYGKKLKYHFVGGSWSKKPKGMRSDETFFDYQYLPVESDNLTFIDGMTKKVNFMDGTTTKEHHVELSKYGIKDPKKENLAVFVRGFELEAENPYEHGFTTRGFGVWIEPPEIKLSDNDGGAVVSFNYTLRLEALTPKAKWIGKKKDPRIIDDDYRCKGKIAFSLVYVKDGAVTLLNDLGKPRLLYELDYKQSPDEEMQQQQIKGRKGYNAAVVGVTGFNMVWHERFGLYLYGFQFQNHDFEYDPEDGMMSFKTFAKMQNARHWPWRLKPITTVEASYGMIQFNSDGWQPQKKKVSIKTSPCEETSIDLDL